MTSSPPSSRPATVTAAIEDKSYVRISLCSYKALHARLAAMMVKCQAADNLHVLLRSTDVELSLCRQRLLDRDSALRDADRRWAAVVGGQVHQHRPLESSLSSGRPTVRGCSQRPEHRYEDCISNELPVCERFDPTGKWAKINDEVDSPPIANCSADVEMVKICSTASTGEPDDVILASKSTSNSVECMNNEDDDGTDMTRSRGEFPAYEVRETDLKSIRSPFDELDQTSGGSGDHLAVDTKSVFAAKNSVIQRQPYNDHQQQTERQTPGRLQSHQQQLSTDLLNKVMEQNARLKKILREIVSHQYGGVSEYLVGVTNFTKYRQLSINQAISQTVNQTQLMSRHMRTGNKIASVD